MKPRSTVLTSALLSVAIVVVLSASVIALHSRRPTFESPPRSVRGPCGAEAGGPPGPAGEGIDLLPFAGPILGEPEEPAAPPVPSLSEELAELEAGAAYDEFYPLAADDAAARSLAHELAEVAGAEHLDERVRGLALWALARTGDIRAAEAQVATRSPQRLRLTAVEMIRRHGGERATGALLPLARAEADLAVREAALRALWHHDAPGAVPLCAELAAEDSGPLGDVALELLARLEPQEKGPEHPCALAR